MQQVDDRHAGIPGYVCVHFLPDDAEAAETVDASSDDADDISARTEARELDRLTREISRQLDAGFRPSDIAVLVRKGYQSKKVIRHLMAVMENPDSGWHHGHVPVVSADSIPVGMSPAVRMVISILTLTGEPSRIVSPHRRPDADGNRPMEVNPVYQRNRLVHRFEMQQS